MYGFCNPRLSIIALTPVGIKVVSDHRRLVWVREPSRNLPNPSLFNETEAALSPKTSLDISLADHGAEFISNSWLTVVLRHFHLTTVTFIVASASPHYPRFALCAPILSFLLRHILLCARHDAMRCVLKVK